jgi:thioredoxin 1
MLYTNLHHLLTAADHQKLINEHENVMICCGRMGPMCIPVVWSDGGTASERGSDD